MRQLTITRVGFLMSVSLLLAAIVYFFAANWSGLERADKILLSAGIMVLFYGAAFVFSRIKIMLGHHSFLSAVLLVGGCISFGVAVALLNQIYNSHADTYELFLIWSIPAFLFAVITRFNPFYILTSILVHITLWQYFFPSSVHFAHQDMKILMIFGLFALINLVIFALIEAKLFHSTPLKWMSFIMFQSALLNLTSSTMYHLCGIWMNIVFVAVIAFGFYYFTQVRLDKIMLTLNALAASAYAISKYFELMWQNLNTSFFILGLVFVALLLTSNILFFRYLNRLGKHKSGTNDQSGTDDDEARIAKAHKSALFGKIASTTVTVIGVIIGSVSLIGLVFLAAEDFFPYENVLFVISLLFLIPALFLPRLHGAVRYTVLAIGCIAGITAILVIDIAWVSLCFLILSITSWIKLHGRAQHFFTHCLFNLNIAILLHQLFGYVQHASSFIVFIMTALNVVFYASHHLIRKDSLKQYVRECGLFFSLLLLFWLTFVNEIFPYSYELFNLLNFITVTFATIVFVRRSQTLETGISLSFWFLFLAYKYYDLFWTLLHKSFTLALLGCIIITATYIYAYRTRAQAPEGADSYKQLLRRSSILIVIVVALQIGYVSYHAAKSESLLANGTAIKLAIEPLDPRSLLQGDYVQLQYSITLPPIHIIKKLESRQSNSKVKVVLRQGSDGLYIFDRLYEQGEPLAKEEIVINGIFSGWGNIYYGIESYFVPEGTGIETEKNARFAHVMVGKNGDAIIEKLTNE